MDQEKKNTGKVIILERFCHYNLCREKESGCPFNHYINEKKIFVNFNKKNNNKLCKFDKPWLKKRCTNIYCNKDHFYGREKWLKNRKKNLSTKDSLKLQNGKKSNTEVSEFLDNILVIINETKDELKSNDIIKILKFIVEKLKITNENNNYSNISINNNLIEYLENKKLLNNKNLKKKSYLSERI